MSLKFSELSLTNEKSCMVLNSELAELKNLEVWVNTDFIILLFKFLFCSAMLWEIDFFRALIVVFWSFLGQKWAKNTPSNNSES